MKLIQLSLLLLLTVIHSGTASPNRNASSGASGGQNNNGKFKRCLRSNCGKKLQACMGADGCKTNLICIFGSETLTQSLNCGTDEDVRDLFNCAAEAGCFSNNVACPDKIQPNLDNLRKPLLVEELASSTWRAVFSVAEKKNEFLDYPCNRLQFQGNASKLDVHLSVCLGNTTTGICDTPYFNFSGNGNQKGNNWIINTELENGPFVLKKTSFDLHIHAYGKDEYFIATGCREGPAKTYSGVPVVFSTSATYDELLRNSNDPQSTEANIRRIYTALGENYDKGQRTNTGNCKN